MRGGGRDREELNNFNPDAYHQSDDPDKMMGCHKGDFAMLNIRNAQPGDTYSWANDTPTDVMKARMTGKRVVHADDPERAGFADMLGYDEGSLDSTGAGPPGVVLMKRSAKDERRVREEQQSQREKLLRSGDAEQNYINRASADEAQFGGKRFMRDDHRTYVTDGPKETGRQVDAWRPGSRGISD